MGMHSPKKTNKIFLQETWNTCQKNLHLMVDKKVYTWMQKEVMHNLIYTKP